MFAADCPTKRAAFMTDMTPGRWSHVPANFQKWEEAQPKNLLAGHLKLSIFFCTVVAIWNYFWSITTGSAASELSFEQGRRKHTSQ